MAAGHLPGVRAADWAVARLHIVGPWPRVLIEMDLSYWADPISCDSRKRPSVRVLSALWGISKSHAGRILRDGTLRGQRGDTEGTARGQPLRDTRGRSSAPSAPSAPSATSAEEEETCRPKAKAAKPDPAGWEEVWKTYDETRRCQGYQRAPRAESKDARILEGLARKHGSEEVLQVLRWVAHSPHNRAKHLREGQYGPSTWQRKWEQYRDLVDVQPPAREGEPTVAQCSRPVDPVKEAASNWRAKVLPFDAEEFEASQERKHEALRADRRRARVLKERRRTR